MENTVVKTACFAGQNVDYTDSIKAHLKRTVKALIENHGVTRFFAAKGGKFDVMCAEMITELKQKYPALELNIVIPTTHPRLYDKNMLYYCDYDNLHALNLSGRMPSRNFAAKVNQYMVDNSDYLVCYVADDSGIAAKALKYANKIGNITIINLADNSTHSTEQEARY